MSLTRQTILNADVIKPGEVVRSAVINDPLLTKAMIEGRMALTVAKTEKVGKWTYQQTTTILIDGRPYRNMVLSYQSKPGWFTRLLMRYFPSLRSDDDDPLHISIER